MKDVHSSCCLYLIKCFKTCEKAYMYIAVQDHVARRKSRRQPASRSTSLLTRFVSMNKVIHLTKSPFRCTRSVNGKYIDLKHVYRRDNHLLCVINANEALSALCFHQSFKHLSTHVHTHNYKWKIKMNGTKTIKHKITDQV